MRASHALFVAMVALLVGACAEPDPIVTRSVLVLEYPDDPDCRPPESAPPTELTIAALGDFGVSPETIEVFPTDQPIPSIDRFPYETEAIRLALGIDTVPDYRAVAIHLVRDEDAVVHALMLPIGRSCASADTEAAATAGAGVAALPSGGFFVAGGITSTGEAMRRVVRVPADGTLAVVEEGLTTRRVGATATRSGARIVIAGGAERDDVPAEETFEIFDVETGRFVTSGPMCREGVCRRRDHGAGLLPSGWILLVGGVEQVGGALINTAVAIDPETGATDTSFGPLPIMGRRFPEVVRLDDGTMLVVGGRGVDAFVGSVYYLDALDRTFREIEGDVPGLTGVPLPSREGAVAVALPGERLAWLGGRGPNEGVVSVLSFRAPVWSVRDFEREDIAIAGFVPLANARAVARADGRILVVGTDDTGAARAFVVDVGRAAAEEVAPPTRAITHLLALADGVIAEVGPNGTSYRRELLRTPFDNPPATLVPDDVEWIAPDVATHFDAREGALTSVAPFSYIHVAGLSFADVTVTPNIEGSYELQMTTDRGILGAVVVTVAEGAARAVIGTCRLEYPAAERLGITRLGEEVVLAAGAERVTCPLDGLTGRVRLALELRHGTTFRALGIERLSTR